MAEDDLDLSSLSDEDLVAQMHDDLYDGLKEEIEEAVRILLDRGYKAQGDKRPKRKILGLRAIIMLCAAGRRANSDL